MGAIFRNKEAQAYYNYQSCIMYVTESGIDNQGNVYFAFANGEVNRYTRREFIAEANRCSWLISMTIGGMGHERHYYVWSLDYDMDGGRMVERIQDISFRTYAEAHEMLDKIKADAKEKGYQHLYFNIESAMYE